MKLLNLCCGATRVVDDTWVNLDNLHATLLPGTPERANLDAEPNYVNMDLEVGYGLEGLVPEMFDGILASHCFEHWDCQTGVRIMRACHRLLKSGGSLIVSVPDATVFRMMHIQDSLENAVRLFGEPIFEGDGESTFAGYALWNRYHKAILCEDSLWAYFLRAGFVDGNIRHMEDYKQGFWEYTDALKEMATLLNRLKFSLILVGIKQ